MPVPDKSKEKCIKIQCIHADMLPKPDLIVPENRWHFEVGDTIGDQHIKLNVIYRDEGYRFFDAQVMFLKDKNKEYGHFGSYVTKNMYYRFTFIGSDHELIWEVKEEGTDRFHREGSTGAQFLLYWFKDKGFSFDLDT